MRVQRRSETVRTGEPPSHIEAKKTVATYLETRGFHIKLEWVPPGLYTKNDYYHTYDIAVFRTEDFYKDDKEPVMIIEIGDIGDDSKHQYKTPFAPNKGQQENDGIAQAWITRKYKNIKFFRLNKDDVYDSNWLGWKLNI